MLDHTKKTSNGKNTFITGQICLQTHFPNPQKHAAPVCNVIKENDNTYRLNWSIKSRRCCALWLVLFLDSLHAHSLRIQGKLHCNQTIVIFLHWREAVSSNSQATRSPKKLNTKFQINFDSVFISVGAHLFSDKHACIHPTVTNAHFAISEEITKVS